ncbi:hypothetical protein WBP07_12465 [Novosphingobium sp. BL-8A]|uniref:zinc finger domain-containing protein n=1 Tax=Novosphingobium sp. BL-8A TaxID=3127639 RepID=UPI003757655A
MVSQRDPLSITCPKCRAEPGVACYRAAKFVGQPHDSRVKGSAGAVIATAQLRREPAGDVEAIEAGRMVLEGRGDGTYAEAEAAIRALIAAMRSRTAEQVLRHNNPEVDAMALVLFEAFKRAEPSHVISQHPASFMATFADMAHAAMTERPSLRPAEPANQASATMHVTVTRALGCYGAAYDMPGPRRAYTSQHQPANEGAWSIGKAHSIAAKNPAGDYIDRGLAMIHALHECGFGVFEVERIDFRGMSPGAEGEATCDRSPLTHQHAEPPRKDQEEGNQADG